MKNEFIRGYMPPFMLAATVEVSLATVEVSLASDKVMLVRVHMGTKSGVNISLPGASVFKYYCGYCYIIQTHTDKKKRGKSWQGSHVL